MSLCTTQERHKDYWRLKSITIKKEEMNQDNSDLRKEDKNQIYYKRY